MIGNNSKDNIVCKAMIETMVKWYKTYFRDEEPDKAVFLKDMQRMYSVTDIRCATRHYRLWIEYDTPLSLLDMATVIERNLASPVLIPFFLEHGADPNDAMHYCLQHASSGIIEMLLKYGADPDYHLHHACDAGKERYSLPLTFVVFGCLDAPEKMRLLLKHGANPRLKNSDGETASSLLQVRRRCGYSHCDQMEQVLSGSTMCDGKRIDTSR